MYIYTMAKSTLQRQKIIADLIEEGNISSQNQLKGILKKKQSNDYTSNIIQRFERAWSN